MLVSGFDGPGIYVHVPFCSSICPYCDFAVTTSRREEAYLEGLKWEIASWSESAEEYQRPFDTIYLGGGTPSALSDEGLESLLSELGKRLPVARTPWISMEVNPEDVHPERAARWRHLGVRTVSLGIQSFREEDLRFLGRRHDAARAHEAIEASASAGFAVVSVDLIYGLPEQTVEDWEEQLDRAIRSGVDHISCYQLTVHEGTPFGRWLEEGRLVELEDAKQGALFLRTHERLAETGWEGYEVSNFARTPSHRSAHNLKYWQHVPYLGLGPSAHSNLGRQRWWNERHLGAWLHSVEDGERPVAGREELSDEQLALETLMLRLRTKSGVDLSSFAETFGIDPIERNPWLHQEAKRGALRIESDRLILLPEGLAITDTLARRIYDGCGF